MNEKVKLLATFFADIKSAKYSEDEELVKLRDYWTIVYNSDDTIPIIEAKVLANEAIINKVLFDK